MNAQQRELQSRVARYIARGLARRHGENPPPLRVQVAHEAAQSIIANALQNGVTWDRIEYNLNRMRSQHYEI